MNKIIFTFALLFSPFVVAEGFIAGTLVKTPSGHVPIEKLNVGDKVLSCDFKGACVDRAVVATVQEESEGYLVVSIAGEPIGVAYDHKFYDAATRQWIEAYKLDRTRVLMNSKYEHIAVDGLWDIEGRIALYNISVEDHHNFYVSNADVLVHNIIPIIAVIIPVLPIVAPIISGAAISVIAALAIWAPSFQTPQQRYQNQNAQWPPTAVPNFPPKADSPTPTGTATKADGAPQTTWMDPADGPDIGSSEWLKMMERRGEMEGAQRILSEMAQSNHDSVTTSTVETPSSEQKETTKEHRPKSEGDPKPDHKSDRYESTTSSSKQNVEKLAKQLQFTQTTALHMAEKGRHVPLQILAEAILSGRKMPDPQGVQGALKIVHDVIINGKSRILEIVYRESDNFILHFLYK